MNLGPLVRSGTPPLTFEPNANLEAALDRLLQGIKPPDGLDGMPCVSFDMLAAHFNRIFPRKGAKATIQVAVQDVGVTRVLHYRCMQAVSDGMLEIIQPAYKPALLPIHLLHAGRGTLPLKMRAFRNFAAYRLRERLDHLS